MAFAKVLHELMNHVDFFRLQFGYSDLRYLLHKALLLRGWRDDGMDKNCVIMYVIKLLEPSSADLCLDSNEQITLWLLWIAGLAAAIKSPRMVLPVSESTMPLSHKTSKLVLVITKEFHVDPL